MGRVEALARQGGLRLEDNQGKLRLGRAGGCIAAVRTPGITAYHSLETARVLIHHSLSIARLCAVTLRHMVQS